MTHGSMKAVRARANMRAVNCRFRDNQLHLVGDAGAHDRVIPVT